MGIGGWPLEVRGIIVDTPPPCRGPARYAEGRLPVRACAAAGVRAAPRALALASVRRGAPRWRRRLGRGPGGAGEGGGRGIDHNQKWLRFTYVFIFSRSRYLPRTRNRATVVAEQQPGPEHEQAWGWASARLFGGSSSSGARVRRPLRPFWRPS
jgi:hypothetical protein